MALTLTTDERAELERRVRSLKIRAEDARRARVILMLAEGDSYSTIEARVPCYRDYINRWRRRFLESRLEGLRARYRGQPPTVLTPTMEARVLAKTQQPPPDGSTHWSTRKLGRVLKIHHNLVAKAWKRAGLQPHRFERYMQSDDPDFEAKAADVIGLYLNPPDHAAVFAVDEKTAIQALDRLDPVLPLSPGRAERHGFEYYRHALALRRAEYPVGRGAGANGAAPYQRRLCRLPQRDRRESAEAARDSRHRGQSLDPQDAGCAHLLARPSERAAAFHADLFVLAQSSGTVVFEDRARPAGPRHLYLGRRLGAQDPSLYPSLQQSTETDPLGLSQPGASN
jgi:transposase